MRVGCLLGLAACLALPACALDSGGYYDGGQPAYGSYAQPGYFAPEPSYVQPYGYVVPSRPGYGRERGFRDRDFGDRDYRDRQSRGDQDRFNRERGERDRAERNNAEQRRFQDNQARQQNRGLPQQTAPIEGGLFPGVPRPMPR